MKFHVVVWDAKDYIGVVDTTVEAPTKEEAIRSAQDLFPGSVDIEVLDEDTYKSGFRRFCADINFNDGSGREIKDEVVANNLGHARQILTKMYPAPALIGVYDPHETDMPR